MPRSWRHASLPPPPWVDDLNDGKEYESYGDYHDPFDKNRPSRLIYGTHSFMTVNPSPPRPPPRLMPGPPPPPRMKHAPPPPPTVHTSPVGGVSPGRSYTTMDFESFESGYDNHDIDTILRFQVRRRASDHYTTPVEVSTGTADQPWLIYQSQYDGDALRKGTHSVKVTKITQPRPLENHLFRWTHVEQPMMDFGLFAHKISQISLAEPEKQQLNDFVSDVRLRTMQRLFNNGQDGREVFHMEPEVIHRGAFTWICMPYFSFEAYSGLEAVTKTPSPCPIPTLMQAYSSSSTKKMDLDQAIRQGRKTPKDHVLHVSQLWCIIVRQCK